MTSATDSGWRVVVTSHQGGRAVFRAEEVLVGGTTPARIVAFAGQPRSIDDGEDHPLDTSTPSTPGEMVVDAMTLDAGQQWPAANVPLFEALVVVSGLLRVTVGTAVSELGPGGVLVSRGELFTADSVYGPTRIVALRAVPDPAVSRSTDVALRSTEPRRRVQRVVAGRDDSNRSTIIQDGEPGVALIYGEADAPHVAMVDMWQTGGPLATADQGGDSPEPYALEPRHGGLKLLDLELKGVPEGTPLSDVGWHVTATIDIDVIVSGTVDVYLRDLPPVRLTAGDIVVQRGTDHLWQAIGEQPLRMSTVMIAVDGS